MKTEEKKDPETRGDIAREDIEIDLDKDGEKIAGGDDTRARAHCCYIYQLFRQSSVSDDTRARADCYTAPREAIDKHPEL